MSRRDELLGLDDEALLAECEVHTYRASGPGGQHRNKVSSAVRLRHRATGVAATAADSRSQRDNRRMALRRLRMELACRLRERPVEGDGLPKVVASCLSRGAPGAARRLVVGPKDRRFWPVAAVLLDLLDASGGRLADAAGRVGITTSNLASVLRSERHLLAAAQAVRKSHGLGPVQ